MLIFEGMLVLAMPFIVKFITDKAKVMGEVPQRDNRVTIIRGFVALLSILGAVLTQVAGDGAVDPEILTTLILAVVNGVFATWIYIAEKNK